MAPFYLFILEFPCSHPESPGSWFAGMSPALVVHGKVCDEDVDSFCPAARGTCMWWGHCWSRVLPLTLLTAAPEVTVGAQPSLFPEEIGRPPGIRQTILKAAPHAEERHQERAELKHSCGPKKSHLPSQ